MEITPEKFSETGAIGLDKSEKRLYACQREGLMIYDVGEIKEIKPLAKIDKISCYHKILITDKYFFGLS